MDREVWSSLTHDPRDSRYAPLRASDHDRSVVQVALDEAYADGRLDRAEYDQRSEQVARVRLLGDVLPLLQDLIAPPAPPSATLAQASPRDLEAMAERHWRAKRRDATLSFLGASLVTTAIWFATAWGDGGFEPYFFWPGIVIVVSLLNLVRTAASHHEIVENEVKRLEKQRAKQLRSRPFPFGPPW